MTQQQNLNVQRNRLHTSSFADKKHDKSKVRKVSIYINDTYVVNWGI